MNLDETSLLYNEGELKIIGSKDNTAMKKMQRLKVSTRVPWVGSAVGMNSPVIFLAKGENAHPRLRGTNLVTIYGLKEGSCVIPNESACMDDETLAKVMKVVSPGIRKIKVSNVACVLNILLSIYLTIHICTSKLYLDDSIFPKVVGITHIRWLQASCECH